MINLLSSYDLFERVNKYPLYIALLYKRTHWHFALDHYNYSRWLSVQMYGLLSLPQNSPQLHKFSLDGYFTFQKIDGKFLYMVLH